MSEDELSEPYDPIMKLYIENLMGTTFKIRMYSTNTVLDLKNKIQRIEGMLIVNLIADQVNFNNSLEHIGKQAFHHYRA